MDEGLKRIKFQAEMEVERGVILNWGTMMAQYCFGKWRVKKLEILVEVKVKQFIKRLLLTNN